MRLLHYRQNIFGKIESEVDGESFFLHKQGKLQPDSEWVADIQALQNQEDTTDQHFLCRFPARAHYILAHYTLNKPLPTPTCPDYQAFKKTLAVDSISLVFASSYVNSPPSAFGHVYLKLHRKQTSGTAGLTDYTVNFGAKVDGLNIFHVIFYGLTGNFKGVYSIVQFNDNMRKYAYLDKREQWLFPLALSEEEKNRVVDHIWELRPTFFYYYFLSENCAYHIRSLLEASIPNLDIRSGILTTPPGLLREMESRSTLIKDTVFVPSIKTELIHRIESLTYPEKRELRHLVANDYNPSILTALDISAAKILDAANLHMDYLYGSSLIADTNLMAKKALILNARTKAPQYIQEPVPPPRALSHSHKPGKFAMSFAMGKNHIPSLVFEARPALHDRMDFGESPGNAFELVLGRIEIETPVSFNALWFNRISLLDMFNYEPSSYFIHNLVWKASLDLESGPRSLGFDRTRGNLLIGLGKSGPVTLRNHFVIFALATGGSLASIERIHFDPFAGILAGVILSPIPSQKFSLDFDFRHFKETLAWLNMSLRHRFLLTQNFGFDQTLKVDWFENYQLEYRAGMSIHF